MGHQVIYRCNQWEKKKILEGVKKHLKSMRNNACKSKNTLKSLALFRGKEMESRPACELMKI
jgi:hypothetical protein